MKIFNTEITLPGTGGTDVHDLSGPLAAALAESGVEAGEMTLFCPGSTAGITTIEYENGVLEDLKAALERMAPRDISYAHDARWGDGNGYSHVRAALVGPSLTIPLIDGRPTLGTWQQVVLLDFDNRPRQRRLVIQIAGNEAEAGVKP
jgi:secondary thiamine-phosphate synthase enzyme